MAVAPVPAGDTATAPLRTAAGPLRRSQRPSPPPSPAPAEPTGRSRAAPRPSRRTRVSRVLLLCILALQAILSLRLHNTAFEDEALYIYSGHMELQHLLHGTALQGQYASYFSGSPVLYPVAAGFLNGLGGLTAARMFSLAEMLSITVLLYSMSRRLFNERIALCAALLFSVCESAIFLGNFATYDATCLFLLALAAWIMVRTAGFRWPVFLLAAPVAALAVGVKYAGLLFVPTIAVLPALAGWPLRGRRVLLYPPVFVAAVAGLLYGALRLGGKAYMTAISSTTTQRAQGLTPVSTLLKESAEWGGVIFVLAVIGTVAYVWRVRTEPEELIAPAGGRFRRLCLGLLLTGTALLAPVYQAHLHTDISFQKHIGFGLFFAAPMAGLGLARLLGDHYRRPHIAVGVWSLALVLGLVQTTHMYQVWPNSNQFVRTFSAYLKPHARYLVEVPEVPIYYLLGHKDAQPSQFTSTFYINYLNSKKRAADRHGRLHRGGGRRLLPRGGLQQRDHRGRRRGPGPGPVGQQGLLPGRRDPHHRRVRPGRLLHLGQGAPEEDDPGLRPPQLEVPGPRQQAPGNWALTWGCCPVGPAAHLAPGGGLSWCRRSRSALPSCPATRSGWWGWRTGTGRRGTRRPSRG